MDKMSTPDTPSPPNSPYRFEFSLGLCPGRLSVEIQVVRRSSTIVVGYTVRGTTSEGTWQRVSGQTDVYNVHSFDYTITSLDGFQSVSLPVVDSVLNLRLETKISGSSPRRTLEGGGYTKSEHTSVDGQCLL